VTTTLESCAALLLTGGASRRMGRDKASLPWHGSTLGYRLAGLLGRVCDPVIVVTAPRQRLPRLPAGIELIEDDTGGEGPLEGLATGLGVLWDRADLAFAAAVDLPFLHPALVRRICLAMGDADAAVPRHAGHLQPLCACYRVGLASRARELLADGERRATALAPPGSTVVLDLDETDARSLQAVHDPAGYEAALAVPQPLVDVQTRGGLEQRRAATLALALTPPLPETIELNGEGVVSDGDLPLVEGDRLAAPWAASPARRVSSPRRS
jgi:molybdenum cofactor guanylyltransferase